MTERKQNPWTADFDEMQDQLSAALGVQVRYFKEYGEIHCRGEGGRMETMAENLPDRRDAYYWMLGRLAAELARD